MIDEKHISKIKHNDIYFTIRDKRLPEAPDIGQKTKYVLIGSDGEFGWATTDSVKIKIQEGGGGGAGSSLVDFVTGQSESLRFEEPIDNLKQSVFIRMPELKTLSFTTLNTSLISTLFAANGADSYSGGLGEEGIDTLLESLTIDEFNGNVGYRALYSMSETLTELNLGTMHGKLSSEALKNLSYVEEFPIASNSNITELGRRWGYYLGNERESGDRWNMDFSNSTFRKFGGLGGYTVDYSVYDETVEENSG